MKRAEHWLEAERLQAEGLRFVRAAIREAERGIVARAEYHKDMARLYFDAAQISAHLAAATPGAELEAEALRKREHPPMPPPPPRLVPVEQPEGD